MKILLGSLNPSKKMSLSIALNSLNIDNFIIESFQVASLVSSKPIGLDMIKGVDNRNNELRKLALNNNIDFDFLCSIEGGFEIDQSGQYFVITYCVVEDKTGNKYYGKSQGIPITKNMFKYLKENKPLHKIIKEITIDKEKLGLVSYLSNGNLTREEVDSQAVSAAFIPILFQEEFLKLDRIMKNNICY